MENQKLRSSGLKSVFLAGALCLVAVCVSAQDVSAQDDLPYTGLSLPLTFGQKFILTNKVLFASSENQLQNVGIVYAYKPEDFSDIVGENRRLTGSSFKIVNTHDGASEDSKRTWDVWQIDNNQIDDDTLLKDLLKEIEEENGFIAISKDDHEKFLENIDTTDEEASNRIEKPREFFIFKSSRQTQTTPGSR